jgi:hypothetical protein
VAHWAQYEGLFRRMTDARPPAADTRPIWVREAERKAAERREPSVKKLLVNLILIAVAAALVCFVAAPFFAFGAIRAAANASDVQGLGRLIDYDAVRASLRPQLSGRPEPLTPPPSFFQDPVAAVRRQFQQSVTRPVRTAVDPEIYLSPRALHALTLGYGRRADAFTASGQEAEGGFRRQPWPAFWSFNRARVSVPGQDGGERTLFTFERRGPFEWRLVHIGLPQAAVAAAPAQPAAR